MTRWVVCLLVVYISLGLSRRVPPAKATAFARVLTLLVIAGVIVSTGVKA